MEYIVNKDIRDEEWNIYWYPDTRYSQYTNRAAKEETILNHIAGVQVGKDKYILPFNCRYIDNDQYFRSIITNDNQSDKNYKERYYNNYLDYIDNLLPLTFYKNLFKEEPNNNFLYLKDNLTNIKIEENINSIDHIIITYSKKVDNITIDLPKYKGYIEIIMNKDVEFNFDKINCPNADIKFVNGTDLSNLAGDFEDNKKIRDKFFNEFRINIKEINCNSFNSSLYTFLVKYSYISDKIKKDAYFFHIDNLTMNNENSYYNKALDWNMTKVKNLTLNTQNPFDIETRGFFHFSANNIKGDSNLILARGYHKKAVGIIKKKKFMIAGRLWSFWRNRLIDKIESAKGIIVKKIEDNPDYVISGDKESSGYNKAVRLGIPILSEIQINFWLEADKIN